MQQTREIIWFFMEHESHKKPYFMRGSLKEATAYAETGWRLRPATIDDFSDLIDESHLIYASRKKEDLR